MKKNLLFLFITIISLLAFKQPKKKKIIFFGDSITQEAVKKDGYITKIDSIVKAKGKGDKYELIGAGISGNRVYDLYQRLDKDVLSKKPDVVVIWIGVNDVWHGKFVTDSNKIMFSYHYTQILKQLEERNIKVIMCTPGVVGEKKKHGEQA